MQWESRKDERTRGVSATRNWHRTEVIGCPVWPRWDLTPGLLGQGIPIILPPQVMCFKWCVGTDGWGTAPMSLSCWGLRISWLKTTNIPVESSLTDKGLWGPCFCSVERIIDTDLFAQGILLPFSECFLTQIFCNRKLSRGYRECQSYAHLLIYCPMMSEWVGMTVLFDLL